MKKYLFIMILGLSMLACSSNQVKESSALEYRTLCSDATTVFLSTEDKIQTATVQSTQKYDLSLSADGNSLQVTPKKNQVADPTEPNLVEVKLRSGKGVLLLEKTCKGEDLTEDRDI